MKRSCVLLALAAIAGCASPSGREADRPAIDAAVREQVREGRAQGYPDLAEIPARTATPADAEALAAEGTRLEAEAAALRALREQAGRLAVAEGLSERAAAVRAEVARLRAEMAAQPPIERPAPR